MMVNVILYTRTDCHLCEQAEADLKSLQQAVPHHLVVQDVDSDPSLRQEYGFEVPVVAVGPYKLRAPFTRQDLEMTLRAEADRHSQLQRVDDDAYRKAVQRSQTITTADRVSYWLSRHYLLLVNLALLLYVGLPFLAPAFKRAGMDPSADVIYKIYSPLCHQWGFRSWYLFGEQSYYPHESAGIEGVITFEQASGITDLNDPARLAAREYQGETDVGYKIALCERDVAIWGALLLFGLIYAATGRRIPQLHWLLWLLVGLGPAGLDGFSQLLSQFPYESIHAILPYRESTPFLRSLTGFLFGFCTAWFGLPSVEEVMRESRLALARKFALAKKRA
ncbi:MAG: DUF2085 domain-containing protein [Chloroflexi bacterium]|nr:DUF2085 domain-containing protein [Chloroflexota bacterium]